MRNIPVGRKNTSYRLKSDVVFLCLLSLIFFLSVKASYGLTVNRVLAVVGGEIITLTEYRQFVKGSGEIEDKDAVDEKILKKLVEEKIIVQEAVRRGLEAGDAEAASMIEEFKSQNGLSQEDLENFLREEGMNISTYQKIARDKVLLSKLISSDVDAKIIIRDKEIAEFYNANKREFPGKPEEAEIKAIFLRVKEGASVTEITDLKLRALRIVETLRNGGDFERLVDEYSDEPLKGRKGILGKFGRGALIPSLDAKAFMMKEGEISDPVWLSDGVYILQIISKNNETFKPFDEVKDDIYNSLYKQKREKLFNEWIKALWEKASVRIHPG